VGRQTAEDNLSATDSEKEGGERAPWYHKLQRQREEGSDRIHHGIGGERALLHAGGGGEKKKTRKEKGKEEAVLLYFAEREEEANNQLTWLTPCFSKTGEREGEQ